ncbi:MAG: DNA double-strand break repair nuclease NurA [Candidatus Hodarchaeales archaeon]
MKTSFQHFLKIINKTQKRAKQRIAKLQERDIHIFDYQDNPPQMIAVDGSNRWIWNNPDLNARIALIRTAFVIYEYQIEKDPPLNLITQNSRDETCLIERERSFVKTYDNEFLTFSDEIRTIISRANPLTEILSLMRSLLEFRLVEDLAEKYSNSLIVMDGALSYIKLKEFETTISNIQKSCKSNDNILIGVSKRNVTKRLKTELTDEAVLRIASNNRDEMVYMEIEDVPIPKQKFPQLGRTFLVKLHNRPIKTFRVDINIPTTKAVEPILSHLAHYSKVNTFPGYPFPLVDAHTIAALLRRVPDMYNSDIIEAGLEEGYTNEEIFQYLISNENLEKDPFHRYLDDTTR